MARSRRCVRNDPNAQYRETRDQLGRSRRSLWTGDIVVAIYLWDCLTSAPQFPTIDVF
jgi:hypothetical protein